jgi:hypothetical protein
MIGGKETGVVGIVCSVTGPGDAGRGTEGTVAVLPQLPMRGFGQRGMTLDDDV